MLSVQQLHKSIDRKPVLQNINFSLEQGQVVGLIGLNGAGKTTLLKMMAGILQPDDGKVELNGRSIHAEPQLKQNLVFVPDSPEALYGYTPQESAKWLSQIYPSFDNLYFQEMLERFSLPKHQNIRHFSKGMKMIFSTILGLGTKSQYVLLDEPTNGVDPIAKKQVLSLLMEAAEEGTTLVISSHLLDELERITDTLLLMKDGGIEVHTTESPANDQIRKYQVVFQGEAPQDWLQLPQVHLLEHIGRVYTVLVQQVDSQHVMKQLEDSKPILVEPLPVKLEDVFIWKLGGKHYVE